MDIKEYYRLAKVENSHWWYRSVHKLVIEEIKKGPAFFKSPGLIKILDAGCGTGGLTEKLSGLGFAVGIDISDLALGIKKHSKAVYTNGSINNLPFAGDSFDLITCISVFYHRRVIDEAASSEIFKALKSGGRAIFVMPAFQWAFGNHDKLVHTSRRYSMLEARELWEKAGFKILEARYIFGILFPEFVIKRFLDKIGVTRNRISDLEEFPKWLNGTFELVSGFENWLSKWIRFPFGSSIYIVVEKL